MKAEERDDPKPMLRDMFASHYVAGLAARGSLGDGTQYIEKAVRYAYKVADAMLKIRDE